MSKLIVVGVCVLLGPSLAWAASQEPAEWSPADHGLRCRLYIDKQLALDVGPDKALIFEINNASDEKLLVPAWAAGKWFLDIDVQVAGDPGLKSPPRHGDAVGATLFLDPGKSFAMNLADNYSLVTGRLKGALVTSFDPEGKDYELSIAFSNNKRTMAIVDKEVPCWTGCLQSQGVRVAIPAMKKDAVVPEVPVAKPAPKEGPVSSDPSQPQKGLTLRLETPKPVYKVGEKVLVDFVLKNVSNDAIKILVEDTKEGPRYCTCSLKNPGGKEIGKPWDPAAVAQSRMVEVAPQKELRLSVDLGRQKVVGPSHFYRPVGQEPVTFQAHGTYYHFTPVGSGRMDSSIWAGRLEAGPLAISIVDPAQPVLEPGTAPWPPEVGRLKALGDIAAGKARILDFGLPWPADKPQVDAETGLKVEVLQDGYFNLDFMQEINAYNGAVRAWAAKQKTPPAASPR
jgi:hypothetical protein